MCRLMKITDRTKAVTQHFSEKSLKKFYKKNQIQKTPKNRFFWMSVTSWCSTCFCVVLCWFFVCTGHFVMVPLNLTCLHCLQQSFFKHFFNLCYTTTTSYNNNNNNNNHKIRLKTIIKRLNKIVQIKRIHLKKKSFKKQAFTYWC